MWIRPQQLVSNENFIRMHVHVVGAFMINLPSLRLAIGFSISIEFYLWLSYLLFEFLQLLMSTGCRVILCPKKPPLYSSDHNYNQWKCIELKFDACFLHNPSIILCDRSGFGDDTNVMKREKWEQLDYIQRNLGRPSALQQPGIPVQPVGISLCTRGAKAKTKLGAKRRYNYRILQKLENFCLKQPNSSCTHNLTNALMTSIAELFMAWMQIPSV